MTVRNPNQSAGGEKPTPTPNEPFLPARDRLLAALQSGPRLSDADAKAILALVHEARETSLADEPPA